MFTIYYKGRKFINGYACDGSGKPITMKNGYSSEDEQQAKLAYEEAMAEKNSPAKTSQQEDSQTKKYSKKTTTTEKISKAQIKLIEEELMKERANEKKLYSENGYLLNEIGEEISLENGYSDADDAWSKNHKNKDFSLQ